MLDETAAVPTGLRHERFVAAPLTSTTAALDHACYVASPDVIRAHSDGRWPVAGFSLADDLALVAQHEDDHENRRSFTFVLLGPSGSEALGCLYLNPLREYLVRVRAPHGHVHATPHDSPSAHRAPPSTAWASRGCGPSSPARSGPTSGTKGPRGPSPRSASVSPVPRGATRPRTGQSPPGSSFERDHHGRFLAGPSGRRRTNGAPS